jgi:hypothetical protein
MGLTLAPRLLPLWCRLTIALPLLGGCTHATPQEPPSRPASAPPPPSASAPQAEASEAPPEIAGPAPPSSSLANPASAAPAVAAPPCGSLSSGLGANLPDEKARALVLDYYRRTLRPRVRVWARDTLTKIEPGSGKLVGALALQAPSVSVEPASETEAQAELDTFAASKAHRIVCRAATVGQRPQRRVNLFTERHHASDIGMVLELFVDDASGEVLLVVYGPFAY